MMYDNNKEKIREEQEFYASIGPDFRMAEVTAISNSRPIVKFYGETNNSQKLYKYLYGYTPAIGDKVLLSKIGGTYVILGKVV